MSTLDVCFTSNGLRNNGAEIGDKVMITFVSPPTQATNVKVEVHETPGPGDEVRTDRLLATYSGQISGGKFKLDVAGEGDPLNPNPANPALSNFKPHGTTFFDLQFADDPKSNPISMPDVEDENGRYEIQLKVTGNINGAPTTVAGIATLNLSLWRDVMIVPDISSPTPAQRTHKDFPLFKDNADFGEQWRKFAGARRSLMKIRIDASMQEFENLVNQAASKAAHGDIILFVGHAGAAGYDPATNTTYLAVFDTTPSTQGAMVNHPNAITETVLNLPNLATRDPANPGKWIKNQNIRESQNQIDILALKFEMLTRIGNVLSQNKVSRFIVLSCKMGAGGTFRRSLLSILKVSVGAYDAYVMTGGGDGTSVQIWTQPEHEPVPPLKYCPPFTNAPNDSSFHEIPGGLLY